MGGLKHGDRAASFTSGALFVGASEANAGSPAAGTFLRGVMSRRVNHCGLSRAVLQALIFPGNVQFELTPKALANFEPADGSASDKPGLTNINFD